MTAPLPDRSWSAYPASTQSLHAELGYAVTNHAAQSRTVTAGLAVITGTRTASTPTSH